MEFELVSSLFPHLGTYGSLKFIGKQTSIFTIPVQFRHMLNRQGCSRMLFSAFQELLFQCRNHSGSVPTSPTVPFNSVNGVSSVFFFLCRVIVLSGTVLPCSLHHYMMLKMVQVMGDSIFATNTND